MNIRYYYRKFIEKSRSFFTKIFRRSPEKPKPPSGVYHWASVASLFRTWLAKPKAFFAVVFRSVANGLKFVAGGFRRIPEKLRPVAAAFRRLPEKLKSAAVASRRPAPAKPKPAAAVRRTPAKPKPAAVVRRAPAKPKPVSRTPSRPRVPVMPRVRAWFATKPKAFFAVIFRSIANGLKSFAGGLRRIPAKLKPVAAAILRIPAKLKTAAAAIRRIPEKLKSAAAIRRAQAKPKPVSRTPSRPPRVPVMPRVRAWFATKPKAFFAAVFRSIANGLKSFAGGLRRIPVKLKLVAVAIRRIPEKLKLAAGVLCSIPAKLKTAVKDFHRTPEKLKSAAGTIRRASLESKNRFRRFRQKPALLWPVVTKYINNKRIDVFLLIVVIVVLATTAANQTVRKNSNLDKHIELVVSWQIVDLFGRDIISSLVQEFEEKNPGLRIRINSRTDQTGVRADMVDANTPDDIADILFFDDGEYSRLMIDSALAPLASYIDNEEQSEQWALQLVSFLDIFFYNIDILQEANSDRPPRTRTEFLNAARAVARQGIAPLALGLDLSDPLALRRDIYPWIWAAGGELFNENGTLTRIAADSIDFISRLSSEGLLAPESLSKTGTQRIEEFAEGKIAMLAASSREIIFIQRTAGDLNFGITAMPALVHGKNRLGLSGIYAGISGESALQDEAWAFLAFIAEKSQILAEELGAVPGVTPGLFPGDYIVKDTLYSKAWDIFEMAEIIEYHPVHSVPEEIERDIWERLTEALQDSL